MKRFAAIILLLSSLAGCRQASLVDYWNENSVDYSDIAAAQDRFAIFAEKAVAAEENEAAAALDVLFDKLLEDEVAYYVYLDWMDYAFYSTSSPCRNAALYGKMVSRLSADGVISEQDKGLYLQKLNWITNNCEGAPAALPEVELDGRRTLVLVMDLSCPSCREALSTLAAAPEWADVRRVAIGLGYGSEPEAPGWEYYHPENAREYFDSEITPVYFVVSADGIVEASYTPAI